MTLLNFSDFEKILQTKKSRKAEFLEILDRILPWSSFITLFFLYYAKEQIGPVIVLIHWDQCFGYT